MHYVKLGKARFGLTWRLLHLKAAFCLSRGKKKQKLGTRQKKRQGLGSAMQGTCGLSQFSYQVLFNFSISIFQISFQSFFRLFSSFFFS